MNVDPSYFGCREMNTFLYDYVERELDERILIALDNHMLVCKECEKLTVSYQNSVETARTHIPRDVKIPEELKTELIEILSDSSEG